MNHRELRSDEIDTCQGGEFAKFSAGFFADTRS